MTTLVLKITYDSLKQLDMIDTNYSYDYVHMF